MKNNIGEPVNIFELIKNLGMLTKMQCPMAHLEKKRKKLLKRDPTVLKPLPYMVVILPSFVVVVCTPPPSQFDCQIMPSKLTQ